MSSLFTPKLFKKASRLTARWQKHSAFNKLKSDDGSQTETHCPAMSSTKQEILCEIEHQCQTSLHECRVESSANPSLRASAPLLARSDMLKFRFFI